MRYTHGAQAQAEVAEVRQVRRGLGQVLREPIHVEGEALHPSCVPQAGGQFTLGAMATNVQFDRLGEEVQQLGEHHWLRH